MDRAGGINFHPKVAGGYRPNADHDMVIGEFQLNQALVDGFVFFENHFSGLVFGLGKWKQDKGWWDGVIPLRYVEIKPHDHRLVRVKGQGHEMSGPNGCLIMTIL